MTKITIDRNVVEQALHVAMAAGHPVKLITALRESLEETNRAQRMTEAGYTRRPTIREMAEPVEDTAFDRWWDHALDGPTPEAPVSKETAQWIWNAARAEPDAYGYASRLAIHIWQKHYKEVSPQWKPLDDLMGVLTQIDNMTSGLNRQQAEPVEEPVASVLEVSGDILTQHGGVQALVNPVNCVGVMGKGLALQFKRAWPNNFNAYALACARGEVRPGRVFVFELAREGAPRWIINFPTKRHWRDPSRMADIDEGLEDLVMQIRQRGIGSVAIPPLGCGLGGLRWVDVRPKIVAAMRKLDQVQALVFEPGPPARS